MLGSAGVRVALVALLALLVVVPVAALGGDETFALTVEDGESGRPVAGATVHVVLHASIAHAGLLPHFEHGDLLALAQRHGQAVSTDAAGVARVPRAALDHGWCVVAHEGRFGAESLYDPDLEDSHMIEVFPDTAARVVVLDADGARATGVPVSLRRPTEDRYPWLWRGTTGEDGEAIVPHVAWRLRRAHLDSCRAVIEVPGVEAEAVLPQAPGDAARVELRLPPTGRVRVVPTGAGAGGRLRLKLREHPLQRWRPMIEVDVDSRVPHVFERVAIGRRYHVDVHPRDRLYRDAEPCVLEGPAEPGAEVVAEPVVDAKNVVVTARIVDEQGVPVRDAEFSLRMTKGGGLTMSSARTDAEGRVSIVLGVSSARRKSPVDIELVPRDASMTGDSRVAFQVPPPHEDGMRDLGDLVLPSAPHVLSGTVVDSAGNGVPGVFVFVVQGRETTEEERSQRWFNPRPVASDEPDDPDLWIWSPQTRAESDEHGRFVMRGNLVEGQPCRLSIHKPGYVVAAPQVARPGADDERIVIERTGRLAGAIVVGDRLSPKWLRLSLRGRPATAGGLHPGTWGTREPPALDDGEITLTPGWQVASQAYFPAKDGVQPFEFRDLRPGRAAVEVAIGDDPDPVARFDGIDISEGAVVRDPRLEALDVTALVRSVSIVVENSADAPPSGAEVRVFRGHGRQTARAVRAKPAAAGKPPRVTLLAGITSRIDVEVRAPGRRAVRVDDVTDEVRVRLEPAIPIRVVLPADWSVPAGTSATCTASAVHPEGKRWFRFPSDGVSVPVPADSGDGPRLLLPSPGRWLVTLRVGRDVRAQQTIDVSGDVAAEQIVELE